MITVEIPDIRKIEKQLGQYKDQAPDVLSRAINGAVKAARKSLANKARDTYTIKISGTSEDLKLKKATKRKLYADLNSKGKVIALSKYKVNPKKPAFGSVSMHEAKNLKESGMKNLIKKLGGVEMKGFTAKMKSGHVGMFVRNPGQYMKDKRKHAIVQLYGPSMPQMIGSSRVAEKYLKNEIEKVLYKHVLAEINRVKAGGGI